MSSSIFPLLRSQSHHNICHSDFLIFQNNVKCSYISCVFLCSRSGRWGRVAPEASWLPLIQPGWWRAGLRVGQSWRCWQRGAHTHTHSHTRSHMQVFRCWQMTVQRSFVSLVSAGRVFTGCFHRLHQKTLPKTLNSTRSTLQLDTPTSSPPVSGRTRWEEDRSTHSDNIRFLPSACRCWAYVLSVSGASLVHQHRTEFLLSGTCCYHTPACQSPQTR